MLSEKDLQIAKIKSAIFDFCNVERFLSKAIREFKDTRLDSIPKGDITVFIGNNNEREIIVKNVPMIELNGEIFENLMLSATIEEILDTKKIINLTLNDGWIDFEELVSS